jgi:hypothetical protein
VFDAQTLEFALTLPQDELHLDWEFLGRKLPDHLIRRIAEGQINPITFQSSDKNCLQKLRCKNHALAQPVPRAPAVKESVGLARYFRKLDRKNPLQGGDEEGREPQRQGGTTSFPDLNCMKKKSLKVSNDEDQSDE